METILIVGGEVRFDSAVEPDAVRRIRDTVGQLLQVKNLVLLIGSGASYHLGSPSIRSVTRTSVEELIGRADVQLSAAAAGALDALVPEDGIDLEALLASLTNSLAYARSVGRSSVTVGDKDIACDAIVELRRGVNLGLARACDLPNEDLDDRFGDDPWHAHREFFRRLLRSRRPDLPRVNVFTTNYDLVIERTLTGRRRS